MIIKKSTNSIKGQVKMKSFIVIFILIPVLYFSCSDDSLAVDTIQKTEDFTTIYNLTEDYDLTEEQFNSISPTPVDDGLYAKEGRLYEKHEGKEYPYATAEQSKIFYNKIGKVISQKVKENERVNIANRSNDDDICGLREIEVNWQEAIGPFIEGPTSSIFSYCDGYCSSNTHNAYYYNGQAFLPESAIEVCCVPSVLRSMTFFFYIQGGVSLINIPNFEAVECDCCYGG